MMKDKYTKGRQVLSLDELSRLHYVFICNKFMPKETLQEMPFKEIVSLVYAGVVYYANYRFDAPKRREGETN